jgi:hypothetical protein
MSNCFRCLSLLTLTFLLTCCVSYLRAQDSTVINHSDSGSVNDQDPAGVQSLDSSGVLTDSTYRAFVRWKSGKGNVVLEHRALPSSTVSSRLHNSDYWYVSVGPGKRPAPESPGWWDHFMEAIGQFFSHRWVWFLFISLLVGFLMWVLVYVVQALTGESLFRKKSRKFKREEEKEMTVESSRDMMQEAIVEAIGKGDYTMAVRYMFLVTLGELEDKGVIVQMRDASNRQYVRALAGKPLQGPFSRLLLYYEYSFYGGFHLDTLQFRSVQEQFHAFHQQLTSF